MPTILTRALDLLYPPRCVSCAAFGANLCERCVFRLPPAGGPGCCHRCHVRLPADGRCRDCAAWSHLEGARAAVEMAGPARRLVHGLKFSGIRDLAGHMAEALRPVVVDLDPAAVFPVPLHRRKRLARGFNQAEAILEGLDFPPPHGRLERVRATASQVGLTAQERRENVAGAFRYRGPSLKGATVAVLDDVVTTGATVNECARVLRQHGAARVYALSFARAAYRTPTSGDADA